MRKHWWVPLNWLIIFRYSGLGFSVVLSLFKSSGVGKSLLVLGDALAPWYTSVAFSEGSVDAVGGLGVAVGGVFGGLGGLGGDTKSHRSDTAPSKSSTYGQFVHTKQCNCPFTRGILWYSIFSFHTDRPL